MVLRKLEKEDDDNGKLNIEYLYDYAGQDLTNWMSEAKQFLANSAEDTWHNDIRWNTGNIPLWHHIYIINEDVFFEVS